MSKITLFTDLDNTMIYSKRRLSDLNNMTCVEYYNGEPLSYMTNNSFSQLQKLSKDSDVQVIPITTRIDYQYERINLPDFKYVILGNGSELRINGVVDEEWKQESEGYRDACIEELEKGFALLRVASKSVRLANDMFVYGKFENTSEIYDILRKCLNLGKVEVFTQGKKVYIFLAHWFIPPFMYY